MRTRQYSFCLSCRSQLAEELSLNGISPERASKITMSYLKEFRKCPDNGRDLDNYREALWAKQLGEYSCMAKALYDKWLYLRYYYIEELLEESNTVTFLQRLRKRYNLGVITNGPTNAQWEKLRKLSLERFFDIVIVSGDSPFEKPQAEIFKEACACLRVDPSTCIMVGDSLQTDIEGELFMVAFLLRGVAMHHLPSQVLWVYSILCTSLYC